MTLREFNYDGLVGPFHNYAGLSLGNVASSENKGTLSNPLQAVLQGLEKMIRLHRLGCLQGIIPPQMRPSFSHLQKMGLKGEGEVLIEQAARENPQALIEAYSAASMWVANAATTAPSRDTKDQLFHLTPANLRQMPHRSIEAPITARILKTLFPSERLFKHHDPLPTERIYGDEGAANHTRFCKTHDGRGVHFFVFGCYASGKGVIPSRYPARQTYEASKKIASLHNLQEESCVFAQQRPEAIDMGAFHNDVVSVGNENVLLYHEKAFLDNEIILDELQEKVQTFCGTELTLLEVTEEEVPLKDAITSYLFNSQLITLPSGTMAVIAHKACSEIKSVRSFLEKTIANYQNPISEVHYFDLSESMKNGGGPACLRLRLVLNEEEVNASHKAVILSEKLYETLVDWSQRHYRNHLLAHDLVNPRLWHETQAALNELAEILHLPPNFYA